MTLARAVLWGVMQARSDKQIAAQVAAALTGTALTITRGDSLSITFTGLGALTARTKLYFTVKSSYRDADAAAIIQIVVSNPGVGTDGLLYLNGAAALSAAAGTIIVTDAVAGDVTITLTAEATAILSVTSKALVYDIKMITATDKVTKTTGKVLVTPDITRATM